MHYLIPVLTVVGLLSSPHHVRAEEAELEAKKWVEAYNALGGVASISPKDPTRLGIDLRQLQKPLVGLERLKPPTGVREVFIQGFGITDDDVNTLARWKGLERIDLVDAIKVTDKGVKALASLPKLKNLTLTETEVTSEGVNAFSGHQELMDLSVINTFAKKNRVKNIDLERIPKLKVLTFVCEGLTTIKLSQMPKLNSITEYPLELETLEITEAKELTELELQGCSRLKKLTLTDLPKLTKLDLTETMIDSDSVQRFRKAFPNVSVLPKPSTSP
jgi:hypothetical protein